VTDDILKILSGIAAQPHTPEEREAILDKLAKTLPKSFVAEQVKAGNHISTTEAVAHVRGQAR